MTITTEQLIATCFHTVKEDPNALPKIQALMEWLAPELQTRQIPNDLVVVAFSMLIESIRMGAERNAAAAEAANATLH